jgi:hypothetical protein
MQNIAMNTPGYVGADLNSLIDEALISSLDRRLMAKIKGEQTDETKEFVANLIDWIKKKLETIRNNAGVDIAKDDPTIIEVNQSDFEVIL